MGLRTLKKSFMNKLRSFYQWLMSYGSAEKMAQRGENVLNTRLKTFFGVCPSCGNSFEEHSFTRIAWTITNGEHSERLREFLEILRSGKWQELLDISDFDPLEDTLVIDLIRCVNGKAIWILTREVASLDDPTQIAEHKVLGFDESKHLLSLLVDSNWIKMGK